MATLPVKFATRICPLCSKKLKLGDEDSAYTYYCEEYFLRLYNPSLDQDFLSFYSESDDFVGGYKKEPHYGVSYSDGIWKQSSIIPPYWVISSTSDDVTRIYKYGKTLNLDDTNLLMEVPFIVPSDYTPEQFAKKIKNLVIFS